MRIFFRPSADRLEAVQCSVVGRCRLEHAQNRCEPLKSLDYLPAEAVRPSLCIFGTVCGPRRPTVPAGQLWRCCGAVVRPCCGTASRLGSSARGSASCGRPSVVVLQRCQPRRCHGSAAVAVLCHGSAVRPSVELEAVPRCQLASRSARGGASCAAAADGPAAENSRHSAAVGAGVGRFGGLGARTGAGEISANRP
jgi:hypothetical protein